MKSFMVSLLILLPLAAHSTVECSAIFGTSTITSTDTSILDFKKANATANLSFADYKQPNSRGLDEYSAILNVSLAKAVSPTSVVLDLGGGKGTAMYELAEKTGAHTVVVNTQTMEALLPPRVGTFEYRKGWAEEVLPEYREAADVITDVWGAFSYSIKKIEILEGVWKSLKPGGVAYILYHPYKTPAVVRTKNGNVDIDTWLAERYPGIISSEGSMGRSTLAAKIIKIKKPLNNEIFQLPLKLESYKESVRERNVLPELVYIEDSN